MHVYFFITSDAEDKDVYGDVSETANVRPYEGVVVRPDPEEWSRSNTSSIGPTLSYAKQCLKTNTQDDSGNSGVGREKVSPQLLSTKTSQHHWLGVYDLNLQKESEMYGNILVWCNCKIYKTLHSLYEANNN